MINFDILRNQHFDILISRHQAIYDWLLENEIISKDIPVIDYVTDINIIKDKDVIGVLPLWLAAHCRTFTHIRINFPNKNKSYKLLSTEDVSKYVHFIVTYSISIEKGHINYRECY